jgi:hypothetical protein
MQEGMHVQSILVITTGLVIQKNVFVTSCTVYQEIWGV